MVYDVDGVFDKLQAYNLEEYRLNAKICVRDACAPDYSECKTTDERIALNKKCIEMRDFYNKRLDKATSFNEIDRIKREAFMAA